MQEDSYIRLDAMAEVEKELRMLSRSLLSRIRTDLSYVDDRDQPLDEGESAERAVDGTVSSRQWLAYPKTLRLTTRPRPPLNPDGTRSRTFNRISRSCDMPSLVLNLSSSVADSSEMLVHETLIPLFHKLHPEKSGWDLSLMNICAANIALTAASSRDGAGRDISKMFKTQEHVLKDWKIVETNVAAPFESEPAAVDEHNLGARATEPDTAIEGVSDSDEVDGFVDAVEESQDDENTWQSDDEVSGPKHVCPKCELALPIFAMTAHERFHELAE